MGKQSRSKSKGKGKPIKKPYKSVETTASLLEKAEDALADVNLEEALEFYTQALALEPDNTNIMDALADLCLQTGDGIRALTLLQSSTTLAPNTNGIKWMFLAQLLQGQSALNAYQTGIQVLTPKTSTGSQQISPDLETQKQIISAYCSIAELYLTDLWYLSLSFHFLSRTIVLFNV